MYLSANITLAEMATTSHFDLREQNLKEAKEVRDKLRLVAALAQKVRDHFGQPISVHSGYRGPTVNARVGGSTTSQHPKAEAIDFHIVGVSCKEVWEWICQESGLDFGQCILETSRPRPTDGSEPEWGWVHLSVRADRPLHRCQMVMHKVKGEPYHTYSAGA